MDNIRCLIADIPHFLLADIIQKITENQPEIDVLGSIDNKTDLANKIKECPVDVLICGMEASETQSLDKVFDVIPNVVVVGLINDGRRICVCSEDVGPSELISLIKSALTR